jgi:putative flippase GtrA
MSSNKSALLHIQLWLIRLLRSNQLELLRYFMAGVGISTGYTLSVIFLMEVMHWESPDVANAVSFAAWAPVSYLVHRRFTFQFNGEHALSFMRFVVTFFVKFLISIALMAGVTGLIQAHYLIGVLFNWVVVPLGTYLVLGLWVFRSEPARDTSDVSGVIGDHAQFDHAGCSSVSEGPHA